MVLYAAQAPHFTAVELAGSPPIGDSGPAPDAQSVEPGTAAAALDAAESPSTMHDHTHDMLTQLAKLSQT